MRQKITIMERRYPTDEKSRRGNGGGEREESGSAVRVLERLTDADAPAPRIHLVGIAGIGMSALAQLLVHLGAEVSGSDRALDEPSNARILGPLAAAGIKLFPQNGSYLSSFKPDALVFSSAIESDNSDFLAADGAVPIVHRADMLAAAVNYLSGVATVAVAGSCGKTTVTAWLAETLFNLGTDPIMVGGGLSNAFASAKLAGNFRPGGGSMAVFEADESDKSLLRYSPDYAVILNIGVDHYPKNELVELFKDFLENVRIGCVLSREVYELIGSDSVSHLNLAIFDSISSSATSELPRDFKSAWFLEKYEPCGALFSRLSGKSMDGGPSVSDEFHSFSFKPPSPGEHTAVNALAVLATVDLLAVEGEGSQMRTSKGNRAATLSRSELLNSVSSFSGVWRRFDFLGYDVNGAEVRDDYAHNPDKIASAISTAHEIASRVFVVFQPHGFKPLEFMRADLLYELERVLSDDDEFCFLPVFYAGGTTSFSPTSEEVSECFKYRGSKKYNFFACRNELSLYLEMNTLRDDMVLILGARDNSLSDFASTIACKKNEP